MKIFLFSILFLMFVTVSLFGQNISKTLVRNDLDIYSLYSYNYSIPLSFTNTQLDSKVVRNILWKPFDIPTMGVQAFIGTGLAWGVFKLVYPSEVTGNDGTGMKKGINNIFKITAVVLGFITIPPSIFSGGVIMGGNGGPWSTIGGCFIGFGVGALFARVNTMEEPGVLIAVADLVGGIVAYHLSALPIYESIASSSQRSRLNIEKELCAIAPNIYSCDYQITIVSIHF